MSLIGVKIQIQSGTQLHVLIKPTTTVELLKAVIHKSQGIRPDEHRLRFNGDALEDGNKMEDYNLYNDCVIQSFMKQKGC